MNTEARKALAIARMADSFERLGVRPAVVAATRHIAARKATEALLPRKGE